MNKKLLKITATAGLAAMLTGCFKENKREVKTIYLPNDCEKLINADPFDGKYVHCMNANGDISVYSKWTDKESWERRLLITRTGPEENLRPQDCEKITDFDAKFGRFYLTCQNSQGETMYERIIASDEAWEKTFIFKRPEMIKPEAENSIK